MLMESVKNAPAQNEPKGQNGHLTQLVVPSSLSRGGRRPGSGGRIVALYRTNPPRAPFTTPFQTADLRKAGSWEGLLFERFQCFRLVVWHQERQNEPTATPAGTRQLPSLRRQSNLRNPRNLRGLLRAGQGTTE